MASTKNLKIKRNSAPDLVCEKMEEFISQGIWKENEKIPSEAELAEMFGVNRFTVRMALQKLNTLGILDTHIGDGTYVRSFSLEKHLENIYQFYTTPELLNDVAEFRTVIEVECARLAIKRHTPEELEELKNYCEIFEKDITAYVNAKDNQLKRQLYFERYVDVDVDLHTQLCKMSHNDLLIYAYTTAKEAIRQQMLSFGVKRISDLNPGDEIISVKSHWTIYHAIAKKDFRTCKKILSDMIDNDASGI